MLKSVTDESNAMQRSVTVLQREENELKLERGKISEGLVGLRKEKAALVNEIEPMRVEREELTESKNGLAIQQRQLAAERTAFDREKEAVTFASDLLQGVLEDRHSIAMARDAYVLTPSDKSQRPSMIELTEVPKWFGTLVQTITKFHELINRAEASEQAFHMARELDTRKN